MKRLGRYILSVLTVLSLVVCVATVGLWVRSHRNGTGVAWVADCSSDTLLDVTMWRSCEV